MHAPWVAFEGKERGEGEAGLSLPPVRLGFPLKLSSRAATPPFNCASRLFIVVLATNKTTFTFPCFSSRLSNVPGG